MEQLFKVLQFIQTRQGPATLNGIIGRVDSHLWLVVLKTHGPPILRRIKSLQVAHIKLAHSRALIPLGAPAVLFDAFLDMALDDLVITLDGHVASQAGQLVSGDKCREEQVDQDNHLEMVGQHKDLTMQRDNWDSLYADGQKLALVPEESAVEGGELQDLLTVAVALDLLHGASH